MPAGTGTRGDKRATRAEMPRSPCPSCFLATLRGHYSSGLKAPPGASASRVLFTDEAKDAMGKAQSCALQQDPVCSGCDCKTTTGAPPGLEAAVGWGLS